MPIQHIFYIPAIFLLGFVFGVLFNEKKIGVPNSMVATNEQDKLTYKPSGKKLFLTFSVFILVFIVTHMFEIPLGLKEVTKHLGGQQIFDKSPVFSSTEIYKRVSQFPTEGLLAYKHFTYTVDFIFPLSFFVFLLTFARFVLQRITIPKYAAIVLTGLPYWWLVSDLAENAVIFSILSIYPIQSNLLAGLLGPFTSIKIGMLVLSIFVPSLLLVFSKNRSTME